MLIQLKGNKTEGKIKYDKKNIKVQFSCMQMATCYKAWRPHRTMRMCAMVTGVPGPMKRVYLYQLIYCYYYCSHKENEAETIGN